MTNPSTKSTDWEIKLRIYKWRNKAMFLLNWHPWGLVNVDQAVENLLIQSFLKQNLLALGFAKSATVKNCWSVRKKNTIFFRVFIASSKHDGDSGNFETVMQTRDAVNGLHYFRELSQKNPSCLGAMWKSKKKPYCLYKIFFKNTRKSKTQPCLHTPLYRPMRARAVPQLKRTYNNDNNTTIGCRRPRNE